jgi:hypothetical protein
MAEVECDHEWEEIECVSDEYDPSNYYGHRQSVEIIMKCAKCGEIYDQSN